MKQTKEPKKDLRRSRLSKSKDPEKQRWDKSIDIEKNLESKHGIDQRIV